MGNLILGLLFVFLFYGMLLLTCFGVIILLPSSVLGGPARAVMGWVPPFLGGDALRKWAAKTAEQSAAKLLAGKRTGDMAVQLAKDVEEGAMRAMLPLAEPAKLKRILACPEVGHGMIGVTAPEALAIADFLRKHRSPAEQKQIHDMAAENAKKIASHAPGEGDVSPLPCPLQGHDHVCCVYANRPLRCRPLHAISIAKDLAGHGASLAALQAETPDESRHENTVAQGVEIGLTRALKSAGLDADVYELNSALATALATPDASERWAKGEKVFDAPLSPHWSPAAGSRGVQPGG